MRTLDDILRSIVVFAEGALFLPFKFLITFFTYTYHFYFPPFLFHIGKGKPQVIQLGISFFAITALNLCAGTIFEGNNQSLKIGMDVTNLLEIDNVVFNFNIIHQLFLSVVGGRGSVVLKCNSHTAIFDIIILCSSIGDTLKLAEELACRKTTKFVSSQSLYQLSNRIG